MSSKVAKQVKKEGSHIIPHGTIETKVEYISVNGKQMSITQYIKESAITIYIGNKDIYCIDAIIYRNADGTFKELGNLNKIRWDSKCSMAENFEQGTDTFMIFHLLMTYIHKNYDGVRFMQFTDMSEKKCSNGAAINLAALKLLLDGKTWYESRFHAVVDPDFIEVWDKTKKRINKIKSEMPWHRFLNSMKPSEDIIATDTVEEIYIKTDTWALFFNTVKSEIGIEKFCLWLSKRDWFNSFILSDIKFNLMSIPFIVDVSTFTIEYKLINKKNIIRKGNILEEKSGGSRKKRRKIISTNKKRYLSQHLSQRSINLVNHRF
jgi:hypothetical protein